MKKRMLCTMAFLTVCLGAPATGQASIFELHFAAVVTNVGDLTGTLDAFVRVGDRVNIDIGYDLATPDFPTYASDPTRGAYLSPGWLRITVNDLFFAMDGVQVDVLNWPDQDLFTVNGGTLWPSVISDWPDELPLFPILGGGLGFIDLTAPFDLTSSDALPAAPLAWHRADIAGGHIGAGTDELSMYDISFRVVPEPTMISLVGFGIAWAVARRRR